ncbi:ABC-type nitrate/sulfonate/bicarbonate transport system substrate-binding protein [Pigmentiphaga kullae]|uniref:ABC-type nitrate/sulfonate/bicarbonate transport system substrate-binding protein n=2 Tax=Pigmentiphaga kullae TaxID=151784 RepID=A0A4Q7NKS5_9BURK|nr:ABC-type nitrate/sulfonate/bicarbonate transport system substrate-binding protein [Pigmentiphaga kullae]
MKAAMKTLCCAALSLFFLASTASLAEVVPIRVGHGSSAEEPLWTMKASPAVTPGQNRDYKLEYTLFRGTDKRFQAFEAGELDIATGSAHSVMMAAAQGIKFKIVASLSREGGPKGFATQYMVLDSSPIKTIADLKGKTVGINGARSSAEIWARLAIKKHGLNPQRDVKWVAVPFPAQGEAVRAGKLDIGAFPQPFAAFEEKRGGMRTVFTSTEGIGQQEDLMLLLVKEEFAARHPAALRAFLADLVKATDFYVNHPRESHQQLIDAKFVNIPLDVSLGMRKYLHPLDGKVDLDSMRRMVTELKDFGYLDSLDPAKVVDMSYLPK